MTVEIYITNTSSKLGQCFEALTEAATNPDYDYDNFCDEGCVDVLLDYFKCLGTDVDDDDNPCDAVTDPTVETDDAVTDPTVETDDAVTVSAISTVTAILVAIAAALN